MPFTRNLANVNVGASANDGTGDLLRDAFIKVNENANAIYRNGQFTAYNLDTKLTPGYSWSDDTDTGMYHPTSGVIAFSLNNQDSLILRNTGVIEWFGEKLASEAFVNNRLATFTGGVSGGNVTVTIEGNANAIANVQVNGIPVVATLPQSGNYEGRFVYYNGDVWIFSCFPFGNGAGLSADPSIGRLAGSDCRWTRFRGDGAVSVGTTLPSVGFEGQQFYETSTNTLYFFISGQWRTAAAVFAPSAPAGIEILAALPSVSDPNNFQGRTVLNSTDNTVYVFRGSAWVSISTYISSSFAGAGVLSGTTFPSTLTANIGEIFRKEGTDAGLYVFDGSDWLTLSAYTNRAGSTAGIKTVASLPTNVSSYNAGDLVLFNNKVYILNQAKTNWDLLTSNGVVTVSVTAGSIGTNELAAGAVTAAKILAGTITGDKLVSNTITSRELAVNSITAEKILANSITSGKIAAGAIGATQIAANAITANNIAAGAITAGKLAAGAISAQNIQAANLAVISQNAGTITAGILRSGDGKMVIDLNSKFIRIEL